MSSFSDKKLTKIQRHYQNGDVYPLSYLNDKKVGTTHFVRPCRETRSLIIALQKALFYIC